jgi:hypothetical protein
MPRYINAESLINIFNTKAEMALGTPKQVFFSAANMVEKLPAADVAEVKHGIWTEVSDGDGIVCSVCKSDFCTLVFDVYNYKYCPCCGTKMDGGDGE